MAKSRKAKLPKKVAGLKVPKALRKSGVLETLVGSRAGRKILADALVAAANAAAAALVKDRADSPGADGESRARGRDRSLVSEATRAAAGAVAGLVTDAAQNLIAGPDDPDKKAKPAPRRRPAKPDGQAGSQPPEEVAGPADGG